MRRSCLFLLLGFLAGHSAFGAQSEHFAPRDFLSGWIEGPVGLEGSGASGALRLGGSDPLASASLLAPFHRHTQVFSPQPEQAATDPDGLSAEAWRDSYLIVPKPEGGGFRVMLRRGDTWSVAGDLPDSHIQDAEWFEGRLHVLLRPPNAAPTSVHLYRMDVAPDGSLSKPQLLALVPPGVMAEQFAVSGGRLFLVGRPAGEDQHRLYELRGLDHRSPGWSDAGEAPIPKQEGWGLAAAGGKLVVFSPSRRDVALAEMPRTGSAAGWKPVRLGNGPWNTAFAALTGRLDSINPKPAGVVHEFRLAQPAEIEKLHLMAEGDAPPQARWRLAKSNSEPYSDWSPYRLAEYVPIEQPGQVVQYQLSHPADKPPVRIKEVDLVWHADNSLSDSSLALAKGSGLPDNPHLCPSPILGINDPHPDPSHKLGRGRTTDNRAEDTLPLPPKLGEGGRGVEGLNGQREASAPAQNEPDTSPVRMASSRTTDNPHPCPSPNLGRGVTTGDVADDALPLPPKLGEGGRGDEGLNGQRKASAPTQNEPDTSPVHLASSEATDNPHPDPSHKLGRGRTTDNRAEDTLPLPPKLGEGGRGVEGLNLTPEASAKNESDTSPVRMAGSRTTDNPHPYPSPKLGRGETTEDGAEDELSPSPKMARGSEEGAAAPPSLSGRSGGSVRPDASHLPSSTKEGEPSPEDLREEVTEGGQANRGLEGRSDPAEGGPSPTLHAPSREASHSASSRNNSNASPDDVPGSNSADNAPSDPSPVRLASTEAAENPHLCTSPAGGGKARESGTEDVKGVSPKGALCSVETVTFPPSLWGRMDAGVPLNTPPLPSPARGTGMWPDPPNNGLEQGSRGIESLNWLLFALLVSTIIALAASLTRNLSSYSRPTLPPTLRRRTSPVLWEREQRALTAGENLQAAKSVTIESHYGATRSISNPDLFRGMAPKGKIEWRVADPLPHPMAPVTAFYRRGSVFAVDPHGTVCSARLRADGSLCPWGVRMGKLPAGTGSGAVAILDHFVVCLARGHLYAARFEDETLGDWFEAAHLEDGIERPSLAGAGDRLFITGIKGTRGSLPLVRSYDFLPSGQVSHAMTHPPLPSGVSEGTLVCGNGALYWVGGIGPGGDSPVFSAPLNEEGNFVEWRVEPSMPTPCRRPAAQFWRDRLWVFGGDSGSSGGSVYTASTNREGSLGNWERYDSGLETPHSEGAAVFAGGRFLVLGGWSLGARKKPASEVYAWRPA